LIRLQKSKGNIFQSGEKAHKSVLFFLPYFVKNHQSQMGNNIWTSQNQQ